MGFISGLVIGGAGGLIVGWMFLPMPAWVKAAFGKNDPSIPPGLGGPLP